jgi:hypothetical protein
MGVTFWRNFSWLVLFLRANVPDEEKVPPVIQG